jgi:hypothetical protein
MRVLCATALTILLVISSSFETGRRRSLRFEKVKDRSVQPELNPLALSQESQFPCGEPIEHGRVGFYAICTNDQSLEYKGIRVERAYLKQDRISTVFIKRGKRVLVRHSLGEDRFGHDSTFFGLFPLLGGKRKQLVIAQFTGGAHCCYQYWIYELYPRVRLLFDGTRFDIGDGFDPITFQDLDGDGSFEFTQKIGTFDYALGCYTCTPQPTMVFKYYPHRRKYLPANRRFASYVLKDAPEKIRKLKELLKTPESKRDWTAFDYYAFDLLLNYIYVGKERKAWRLYDRFMYHYENEDPRGHREIRKKLKADPLYRFIYSR